MGKKVKVNASILIIGNEILSGRLKTQIPQHWQFG